MNRLVRSAMGIALGCLATVSMAQTVATSVRYSGLNHSFLDISGASFGSVSSGSFTGNIATVEAGASLNLQFNAIASRIIQPDSNNQAVQVYVAWADPARALVPANVGQIILTSSGLYEPVDLGARAWTTTAPMAAGTYFIGGSSSQAYAYADVVGGTGSNGNYSFQVNVVPEPETYAMLLAGLGLVGLLSKRRMQPLSDLSPGDRY